WCCCCCFFFSSRRRHTRSKRDWSSDVCSSDLDQRRDCKRACAQARRVPEHTRAYSLAVDPADAPSLHQASAQCQAPVLREQIQRSEERRVGKECSSRGSTSA